MEVLCLRLKINKLKIETCNPLEKVKIEDKYYIDKNIKTIEENDFFGIIVCKEDNECAIINFN